MDRKVDRFVRRGAGCCLCRAWPAPCESWIDGRIMLTCRALFDEAEHSSPAARNRCGRMELTQPDGLKKSRNLGTDGLTIDQAPAYNTYVGSRDWLLTDKQVAGRVLQHPPGRGKG